VDTTPPAVEIVDTPREERIFSPNNDGNKDRLVIEQSGSVEELWRAEFQNAAGETVRSYRWDAAAPQRLVWDGQNEQERLVPDGVYTYRISATDRAGNSTTAEYANIVKNTEATPVSVTINRSHFSPNDDGVKDELLLSTDVPVKRGIERWSLAVKDADGTTVQEFTGDESAPGDIIFEGRGAQGNRLEEGWYRAQLSVLYRNGNNPRAESPRFRIDVTPPSVSLNANTTVFSPNGDGNKDVIVFNQETSAEETWYGYITDDEGERVLTYKWVETAKPRLSWDGRGETGNLLDDGVYYYQLVAEDRAGNRSESRRLRFELDTKETEVLLTAGSELFSPNGDGRKDSIRLLPKLQDPGDVVSYRLTIEDEESGEVVRRFEGSGSVPETIRWDGFLEEGGRAEDGTYRARIRVTYRNGNQPTANTQPFGIDTAVPEIEVSAEYSIFSPDGDGNRDSVRIRQDSSNEELWQGEVRNAAGETVKSAFWKGEAGDFVWDGTDNAGNVVPDGEYSYTVHTEDGAGNRARETVEGLTIDTAPTKIFVTASSEYLSPNGDGTYEEIAFNTIVNRSEGLESWFLELVDETGTVQRRFSGNERIPKRIVWDGTNSDGEYVEGRYTARFGASYTKGNEPRAESLPFMLDRTAPRTEVQLSPKPFSPDNDGVDDELKISLAVEDRSAIAEWSLTIYDTKGNRFKEFSGTGEPAETLIWDGRGMDGELVLSAMDYPYEFTVTDVLENTAVTEGDIPVDVLVVREDGQLKIKISNINFQPNSAEFVEDDPEIAQRNQFVLDRVAEILQKYRQYEITIEGHAVITRWYDEEAAEKEQEEELLPLSEQRAERVLNALVERGVARDRLNAVGVGGSDPLVPHSDLENRWKNRRVEFILEKE
jgi:outer membrane protein OmpA-like peptidoglycan-associated protein/flagellar hook assembly protein FlgD